MKRFLLSGLFIFLLLAFGTPTIANVLKLGLDADPVALDPHVQLSGNMLQYSHITFDPLVRWTKEMTFEPRLAERWEQVDSLTMRFYLKKGVTFHSGNPFTAADIKWTIARLKKSIDYKGLFTLFADAVVVDDYTIDIKTTKPYNLILNMATYIFPMDRKFYTGTDSSGKPKDAIEKTNPSFANVNASGTGPFKVVSHEKGVKLIFERYKEYWDKKSPGNVSKILLTPIKQDATRIAALLSGDVDMISPVPPQDYARVERDAKTNLVTLPGSRIISLQLNQKRRKEFADKRVRQAMVYAINNVGIAKKIMKGTATPAGQQAPEGFDSYKENLVPRYDLKKALKLMKEAGFENGFECSMISPNNRYVNDEKIAEAAVAMLKKINIKVRLKTMPKAQYWDEFDKQVADIQLIGWHSDTEDAANFTEYLLMCPNTQTGRGQYNSGNYCNEKVDELIEKALVEADKAKRKSYLEEVEQIVYDEAAFVPLHWQNHSWAAKKNLKIEPIVNMQNFPYYGDLVVN